MPRLLPVLSLLLVTWKSVVAAPTTAELLAAVPARALGPANMGGRICDVAVVESRPSTIYLATASGGLWKTINHGTTWVPVFDGQPVGSIGAVAVAPSQPEIVYVGTGEANARNSVTWGDGVYRSTDGGKSWKHCGLRETHHIGRIAVHPNNPEVAYVAALGHLWGPNPERGLYKTTDGGLHWRAVKFIDNETGFIDVIIDPKAPETVYAAAYRVQRGPFSGGNPAVQFGPGAGLYKSVDGGTTWQRLKQGLPDRPIGRSGLAVWRKDPRIVYAIIQTDQTDIRQTVGQAARPGSDAATGGVFRSEDGGATWTKLNDLCPRPFYYGQIRVEPTDANRVYVLGIALHLSTDGGRNFVKGTAAPRVHADHHALWIDPADSKHMVLGNDGGVYWSRDGGETWEHGDNLPLGQFYGIGVDTRQPYRIYGGLQDNGTWGGPSATRRREGVTNADWMRIMGADGFQCCVDPADPDTVYCEAQYGQLWRCDVRTGTGSDIRPRPGPGEPVYRFNWNSPIVVSPHNSRIVFFGGNHVFRSLDRGERWSVISPDLTRGEPGASSVQGHTLTALAESPMRPGLLYTGSDDGRVHVSRDGGARWADVSDRIPNVPAARWITRIECSRHVGETAYLALDRHRQDDRKPYLFKTTDAGASWQSIAGGLPSHGQVHVIREDTRNKDLLYVGTEFGLWATLDGGHSWSRLGQLPAVAVHDLALAIRDRELVAGTHGRGIFVLDVAPLRELTATVRESLAYLCDVRAARSFTMRPTRSPTGSRAFAGVNPTYGANVWYYLKSQLAEPAVLTVRDGTGRRVAEFIGAQEAGLHRLVWPLRRTEKRSPGPEDGVAVDAGDYSVSLTAGGRVQTQRFRVEDED
jgi:photosystem II stability/assembly factor-like uncharacterized protein